jgi:hypothetical protein
LGSGFQSHYDAGSAEDLLAAAIEREVIPCEPHAF